MSPSATVSQANIFTAGIKPEVKALTDTQGTLIPKPTSLPLEINDIYSRPCNSNQDNKRSWGTAGYSTSSQFKRLRTDDDRPMAKRWDNLLTSEALTRNGGNLKKAARFLAKPGLISLGGGLPSSEYFPFEEVSVKIPEIPAHRYRNKEEVESSGETSYNSSANASTTSLEREMQLPRSTSKSTTLISGKHDLAEGTSIFDISTAFNYGQGSGSAQLLRFVTEHTELVHDPPYKDWACNLNIGSTSGLDCSLRMLCNPGDSLLSEMYTFSAAVETARPLGINVVGVPLDGEGLMTEALDEMLSNWNTKARGARKPRVLYTIPTGQNPTGATMGIKRREAVYAVCQKHDIFIIEDEPYYFLQMPEYGRKDESNDEILTRMAFLETLIPSFLSLDVDGRVIRLDSFSKVIAPGTRVGWVTASEQVIDRYRVAVDCSTQGPSGISQLVLYKLLDEHWGHGGYIDWLMHIREEYTTRRNVMVDACERYLPKDIVSWVPPKAGMFHWLKIAWQKHPEHGHKSMEEIEEEIFMACVDHGTLLVRGSWFVADPTLEQQDMFFRSTYAAAPAEQIAEAIRRFSEALEDVFRLEKITKKT